MFLKNKLLLIIFAISLLAHVIVIYVMARSTKLPAMTELNETNQPVIQARLIFALPPVVVPPEEKTPEPEKSKSTPVEPKPEPIEEVIIEEITNDAVADESATQAVLEDVHKEENQQPTTQKTVEEPFFQNNTISPAIAPQNPLTNMARRHLRSFQQQQQNKVAEQASRSYRQQKTSPVIDDDGKGNFLTEDEKFTDSRTIKADCSSTGNKTTAVLLSFLGGQVDCSQPPPINSFIQNRINKESQLPSLKHQQKKRPKSVVIENQ